MTNTDAPDIFFCISLFFSDNVYYIDLPEEGTPRRVSRLSTIANAVW